MSLELAHVRDSGPTDPVKRKQLYDASQLVQKGEAESNPAITIPPRQTCCRPATSSATCATSPSDSADRAFIAGAASGKF